MEYRALRRLPARVLLEGLQISALVVLYLHLRVRLGIDWYDEGIRLYGAMRIVQGAQPYHDFFAYYGPAQFYWPAALFAIFGEQAVVMRYGALVFVGVGAVALTALVRRTGAGPAGMLFTAAAILLGFDLVHPFAFDPALALVLAAGVVLTGGDSTPRLVSAGVLIGLASLFRHDFGLYGAVAAALGVTCAAHAPDADSDRRWQRITRRVGSIALGVLVIALPAYGLLALRSLERLVDCLIIKPPQLMEYRSIPYGIGVKRALAKFSADQLLPTLGKGALASWILLGPFTGLLGVSTLVFPGVRKELLSRRERVAVLAFLLTFGAGVSVYAFSRSDAPHAYPLHCVTAALLAIFASAAVRALSRPWLTRGLALGVATSVGTLFLGGFSAQLTSWEKSSPAPWARARGLRVSKGTFWMSRLIRDVEANAGGKPIFVASNRHDRVHKNLMTAYFLTGRAAATYYQDLLPGFTTRAEVQSEIIKDLETSGARAVVVWNRKLPSEPNPSATEKGAKILDEYLKGKFVRKQRRGQYHLLVRRD